MCSTRILCFMYVVLYKHTCIKGVYVRCMSPGRQSDFFKALAQSIRSERIAQRQERDAATQELLALKGRLVRLWMYETLSPDGDVIRSTGEHKNHSARGTCP